MTKKMSIHLSCPQVIAHFENQDYRKHWQPGFMKADLLEGQHNHEGAVTRLVLNRGRGNVASLETIESRTITEADNKPVGYSQDINTISKGMKAQIHVAFSANTSGDTDFEVVQGLRFSNLLLLLKSKLMPHAFASDLIKYMQNFKYFCESVDKFPIEVD